MGPFSSSPEKLDRGLEDLNAARHLNPNTAMVHNGFCPYYNEKREYDRAIVELEEAIRLALQFFIVAYAVGATAAALVG